MSTFQSTKLILHCTVLSYMNQEKALNRKNSMCKAYSKPKKRLEVPTMRKHVRQKMPDCLAIA